MTASSLSPKRKTNKTIPAQSAAQCQKKRMNSTARRSTTRRSRISHLAVRAHLQNRMKGCPTRGLKIDRSSEECSTPEPPASRYRKPRARRFSVIAKRPSASNYTVIASASIRPVRDATARVAIIWRSITRNATTPFSP